MKRQKDLINRQDWDTLIILDACRWDYFVEEYSSFIHNGKLECILSPASNTFTWLRVVFPNSYDITVYGSHPVLNSFGFGRSGYTAKPHFRRIVDIWKEGWDNHLSTVPPEKVNSFVLKDIRAGVFQGINIIWYMQPHAPWIGRTRLTEPGEGWDEFVHIRIWKAFREGKRSLEELRRAYRDNVKLVLEWAACLIPFLKGRTIVTSDHGELLGEGHGFEHPPGRSDKELREVPWLIIDG